MAASNASANGSASTPTWRAIFGLIVFSCRAAFITGGVAFSYPVPMLDGPLTLVIPAHNDPANMVTGTGGAAGTRPRPAAARGMVVVGGGRRRRTRVAGCH